MNKKTKRIFLIADVVLVVMLGLGLFFFQRIIDERDRKALSEDELNRRHVESIRYQGKDYPLKRYSSTVLLIGTDNFAEDEEESGIELFYNMNLADFMIVLAFDHEAKTVTPFQICRDTMCDVPWISVNGMVGGTRVEQIALAHSYGSGGKDSCINTRNAVENLLYGLPIDSYFAFTMDTVPLLNDLVGGVTVKLEDDIPALGPEYTAGASVTLRGKEALRFVRYRDRSKLDGNLNRMAHHRVYLDAFLGASRRALESDPDLAVKAFDKAERFLCTDLTVENVSKMVDEMCEYEVLPVVTPGGKYVSGEKTAEYYVDDASLWDCVYSTFCKQ